MTDDDEFLVLETPSRRDTAVPPARWAVPATTLPPLPVDTLVTVRVGETGWIIDELMIAAGPVLDAAGVEGYRVAARIERAAAHLRPGSRNASGVLVQTRWLPTDQLFVYRDSTERRTIDQLDPALDWLGRVVAAAAADQHVPPAQHARPARELPSLTGQRARTLGAQRWEWVRVHSEPHDAGGDFVCDVLGEDDAYAALYGQRVESRAVPLHALWVY